MNSPSDASYYPEALAYAINHVFLPPKTPQEGETNIQGEHDLTSFLLESVVKFSQRCSKQESKQLQPVIRMLQRLMKVTPGMDGSTKKAMMTSVIQELKNGEFALFHIRAQNAGLLMTGQQDGVLIEAFELLAPNSDVMSYKGRLSRQFPDCAAIVDRKTMLESDFLSEFVNVLSRLELQWSPLARPKTWKSGRNFDEERDTVSPFLVTDMVLGTLGGLSRHVEPIRVSMRSREQVGWDNALLPFHRSPTWLLLRVGLRLVLNRGAPHDARSLLYKAVMAFHHAHLLDQAKQLGADSDIRYTMAAKLVRRLTKLSPQENLPWVKVIRDVVAANHDELQQRWQNTQNERETSQANHLKQLCFSPDTNLRLGTLGPHLAWLQSRSMVKADTAGPGDLTKSFVFAADNLPVFPRPGADERLALLELEQWIELNLAAWLINWELAEDVGNVSKTKAESDMQSLKELTTQYYAEASKAYLKNPEALSLMYLNLMDLWVAMDKVAGAAVPLLLEYDPCFPPGLFRPLILPTKRQMARLHGIEAYLSERDRQVEAIRGGSYGSMYSNFGQRESFAVRYFDSSPEHQLLLQRIEDESKQTETKRIQRYHQLRTKHDDLARLRSLATHQVEWNYHKRRNIHVYNCEACVLDRQIKGLTIDIFEWPLPPNPNMAKAIVFEIRVPKVVAIWRDFTSYFFLNVFRDPGTLPEPDRLWFAAAHSGLSKFDPVVSQVQAAATVKPVEASHYRGKHISKIQSESEVSVRPHWSHYDYFEATSQVSHQDLFDEPLVPTKCSFAEHQPGRYLAPWTRNTGHTSNKVISAQSECPPAMPLEEFRAFGHIRSDLRLQWANVLCQLIAPSLDWNQESTYWLVLQACLEAGPFDPNGSIFRETHADLLHDDFVRRVTAALGDALGRFRENWQNDVAVSLLACLGTRVLGLTTSRPLIDSILAFLSRTRRVTLQWARQLLEKQASCNNKDERHELDQRVLMMGLTCMSTFDVESDLLRGLLHSADNLSTFVETATIIQDHLPPNGSISNPILLLLSHRWRRTMHLALDLALNEIVKERNPGFHAAIQQFWADYSPSATQWFKLGGERGHILFARANQRKGNSMTITYNLLNGRLLVNGYPLSRLPPEYECKPAYEELFGSQVLEVMPSTRKGMRFSACRDQQGWVVHFTMASGELVIQAVRRKETTSVEGDSNTEVYEFIPSWKLDGDVPTSFIRDYSHWVNLSTRAVEFRRADEPWVSSPDNDNWILTRIAGGRNILSRHGCYLIEPHSQTAEAILSHLSPLETRENLNMVFHPSEHVLVVDLPRYSLSFTLSEGDSSIKSKHYSGMSIDPCQNIGSLIGLENKLVLKQESVSEPCTPQRMVLVPRGLVSSRIVSHHVKVSVGPFAGLTIKHDAFTVDSRLGRITASGSLSSKLYLCYLHALTSHCLTDPLTGRTGTEEALRILASASVRSFQRLDSESYYVLCGIAGISPRRLFYPKHKCDMEQVGWSDGLPVLSQHDAFWPEVEAILEHARDCELLQQRDAEGAGLLDLSSLKRSDPLLASRAMNRNAVFRVSEFGAENHTAAFDSQYSGRHRGRPSEAFERATAVAGRLVSGSDKLVSQPSGSLRQTILQIVGQQFPGYPEVDLTFSLDYLQPHPKSLGGLWCGLHTSVVKEPNKYKIAWFLSALIYAKEGNWDLIRALLGMAISHVKFRLEVKPPREDDFDLDYNISTMKDRVKQIVQRQLYDFSKCPEAQLPLWSNETEDAAERRRYETWSTKTDQLTSSFVSKLEARWSSSWSISRPAGEDYFRYMNDSAIMQEVNKALDLARRTSLFTEYLDSLLRELGRMGVRSAKDTRDEETLAVMSNDPAIPPKLEQQPSQLGFIRSRALFSRPAPPTERPQLVDFTYLCGHVTQAADGNDPLANLFGQLARISTQKPYQIAYISKLQSSAVSTTAARYQLDRRAVELDGVFRDHFLQCQQATEKIRSSIEDALSGRSIVEVTSQGSSLYPRISPVFLLQHLTRGFWDSLSEGWQVCLVNYALSLAYVQRAERLVNASRRPERQADLLKELRNMGSHNSEEGDPMTFPENLVLELEQGILIRPVQQGIAAKMRDPPEGDNAVMQLNMGEGKSSVIVPIVAADLADGDRLVRIVVAKPQSKQMMHTLIGTLGGLINRRVFYLPISRALQLSREDIRAVKGMLETCRKERGVLLVQPEHLLSFKLMGLESIHAGIGELGQEILSTYREFEDLSRDIVDESDENFSVKFELIYTIGSQQPIDMSPDRWVMIQELMDVLVEIARKLANGSEGQRVKGLLFEENEGSGRYPTIRVLEESAGKYLVDAIAKQICRTGLRGFPIQHQSKQMRQAVLEYILLSDLDTKQIATVEDTSSGFFSEPTSKNALLLLRGLLATNVILFALGQKRFRVNYGLAPDRRPSTMLAVPYRAKDSPAPRSEFSHPDVVIVLTCLSYYYQGLSDHELRICLERLSRSDQAEQEYSRWAAASPKLPSSLAHFSGVNLKDTKLCKKSIFPALRYAKPAIDFYLANVVFPKEMREFPFKLSASGWDLGKTKRHPLTGFSGTTDSKYVLPLSVTALNLPEQRHTNSAVLACLLRAENSVLELGGDGANLTALTVEALLGAVTASSQSMRVILDVGAQIIELSNLQVARRWLDMVPFQEADAVIFFNDHDELSVLTRNGTVDSFLTSPFATQTDRCLVFLDQAHTRGTDLKLPDSYRAAVTLGPGVTKDTLVQACMRMRKLGQGQSVTFCVSPEMQKRIRTLANLQDARALTVTDILICAIAETWDDAHRSLPLWATQGIRHQHQEVVWEEADKNNAGSMSADDVARYLEDEAQSLEQRYRPTSTSTSTSANATPNNPQSLLTTLQNLTTTLPPSRHPQLTLIRTKCTEFALTQHPSSSTLQEEQERELAPETERERQVERPAPRDPAQHSLQPDVRRLAAEGVLNVRSRAFMPAFAALARTSAAALLPRRGGVAGFPSGLLATADFARTVVGGVGDAVGGGDAYQRPAQWVVTVTQAAGDGNQGMRMVLVSSWEANLLKAVLETASQRTERPGMSRVFLRAYLPRSSLSFDSLEDLAVYTVPAVADPPVPPPELVTQLNLFAGQLYLRSYADYVRLCRYLGLSYKENQGDEEIAADGFVGRAGGKEYKDCEFESSPVGFLNVLFKRIRRDCLDIEKTHMGRILAGEILRERDFEEIDVRMEDVDDDDTSMGEAGEEEL